jgi:hypothetical protein
MRIIAGSGNHRAVFFDSRAMQDSNYSALTFNNRLVLVPELVHTGGCWDSGTMPRASFQVAGGLPTWAPTSPLVSNRRMVFPRLHSRT